MSKQVTIAQTRLAENGQKHVFTQVIKRRKYVVSVGFETNSKSAFVSRIYDKGRDRITQEMTHILAEDYGHAFFYLTKNDIVQVFFSFGPNGLPKKNFLGSWRQGTADYLISEKCTFYRMQITESQAMSLIAKTNELREKIESGEQKYTAYVNDTCAETAFDILKQSISNLPDGSGPIKPAKLAPSIRAINPYMWEFNFSKSIFAETKVYYPSPDKQNGIAELKDSRFLKKPWMLQFGDNDPLRNEGYV